MLRPVSPLITLRHRSLTNVSGMSKNRHGSLERIPRPRKTSPMPNNQPFCRFFFRAGAGTQNVRAFPQVSLGGHEDQRGKPNYNRQFSRRPLWPELPAAKTYFLTRDSLRIRLHSRHDSRSLCGLWRPTSIRRISARISASLARSISPGSVRGSPLPYISVTGTFNSLSRPSYKSSTERLLRSRFSTRHGNFAVPTSSIARRRGPAIASCAFSPVRRLDASQIA